MATDNLEVHVHVEYTQIGPMYYQMINIVYKYVIKLNRHKDKSHYLKQTRQIDERTLLLNTHYIFAL